MRLLKTTMCLGPVVLGACAETSRDSLPSSSVVVSVSPLTLPGVTNAVYDLVVKTSTDTVWSKSSISADNYGDGAGAITYVGACDAQAGNHSIELTLVELQDANGVIASSEYVNPCPSGAPCIQTANCVENSDTAVSFNLVVMRDADQGFFDIGVNFSDVFCSAKVDCREELLFVNGSRDKTTVLGFACTSGDANSTHLYIDDLTVTCSGADPITLDMAGTKGQQGAAGGGLIAEWAIYSDTEELSGYRKGFWNAAIALGGTASNCTLTTKASASQAAFAGGWSAANTVYPIIEFDVNIGGAADACHANQPLDGAGSGVTTSYSAGDGLGVCFRNEGVVNASEVTRTSTACAVAPTGFALAPKGTFMMGLSASAFFPTSWGAKPGEETERQTTLTRNFWVGLTEVTQAEYQAVMGGNPSFTKTSSQHPVENLTFFSAASYANQLSTNQGLENCYAISGCTSGTSAAAGTLAGCSIVERGQDCHGYRIPTEAEWEYAARAGETRFVYVDPPVSDADDTSYYGSRLRAICWFYGNSGATTKAVATQPTGSSFSAGFTAPTTFKNAWGLSDVLGNVWEFTTNFSTPGSVPSVWPSSAQTDPVGETTGTYRVVRGTSFNNTRQDVRFSRRGHFMTPDKRDKVTGFRLVRTAPHDI